MRFERRIGWAALAIALAAAFSGCGTPGAPEPPSLNLPDRVTDLSAVRTGSRVALAWTMPKRNTDRMLLKVGIPFRICMREDAGACATVSSNGLFPPGSKATLGLTLPASLASGPPRALTYFVELPNRNGKSAGLSNGAALVAGDAPGPVTGLSLAVRKQGVEVHWDADAESGFVRLRRTLLTPPKPKSEAARGPLTAPPERVEQNLAVENGAALGRALDKSIHFGETYEYRAQHVARVVVDNQTVELDGELSAPVRIDAEDVFPPAVPVGLAAVTTEPAPGAALPAQVSIDLSWQPNSEADLAGYVVYRREEGSDWQRVSGAQPVLAPSFQDKNVERGHTYLYAVSSVDQNGHQSERSVEARETVPAE